jgi:Sigma-70, region 4
VRGRGHAEVAGLVRDAVQLLPPDQRRVIELAYFQGLRYREVALAAGIPEGTAKSRLRLALAKLETMLDRQLLEQSRRWRRSAGRLTPSTGCSAHWIQTTGRGRCSATSTYRDWSGVEDDAQRCLAGDPAVAAAGHVASTQAAAARQAGRPAAASHAEWRHAVHRTLGLVQARTDLDAEVAVHGMRLPLNVLLVVRAFEIWVHDNDIRGVAGLPPAVPDPPTLHLMTDLAARLLPRAAAASGVPGPVAVHLVLTGPGGGTWDVTLDAGPRGTQPDPVPLRIVTDAVGFCQLVASRARPADLELDIAGDPGRAARSAAPAVLRPARPAGVHRVGGR